MTAAVPAPGPPPDPPEGNPPVINSFAGVALTAAARHPHVTPAAGWVLLILLALLTVLLADLVIRLVRR